MSNTTDDTQKENQKKLQHLVNVAFERGLVDAITLARAMNDPYMLDAFHDLLVDTLHTELVKKHELEEIL